jgi:hypothetical protein
MRQTKYPEWRQLLDLYGEDRTPRVILHDEIATATRMEVGTRRYYTQTKRWRDHMRDECEMVVLPKTKVGYSVEPAGEAPHESRRQVKRGLKRMRTAVKVLRSAANRLEEMDKRDRALHTEMSVRLATMVTGVKTAMKEISRLPWKPPELPRPKEK